MKLLFALLPVLLLTNIAHASFMTRITKIECTNGANSIFIGWDSAKSGLIEDSIKINNVEVDEAVYTLRSNDFTTYRVDNIFEVSFRSTNLQKSGTRFQQAAKIHGQNIILNCRYTSKLRFFTR